VRYLWIAPFLFVTAATAAGCNVPPTAQANPLLDQNLEPLKMPDPGELRQRGIPRQLPGISAGDAWRAVIAVAIQSGVVVRPKVKAHILAIVGNPPAAVFVDDGNPTTVYYLLLEEWYRMPAKTADAQRHAFASTFFDRVATQAEAPKKWRWLR
jgi:hypothetical protein